MYIPRERSWYGCQVGCVAAHAAHSARRHVGDPEVLRQDFRNSLIAAYRPDEVRAQLAAAGLAHLAVEQVTDRHLLVTGRR